MELTVRMEDQSIFRLQNQRPRCLIRFVSYNDELCVLFVLRC